MKATTAAMLIMGFLLTVMLITCFKVENPYNQQIIPDQFIQKDDYEPDSFDKPHTASEAFLWHQEMLIRSIHTVSDKDYIQIPIHSYIQNITIITQNHTELFHTKFTLYLQETGSTGFQKQQSHTYSDGQAMQFPIEKNIESFIFEIQADPENTYGVYSISIADFQVTHVDEDAFEPNDTRNYATELIPNAEIQTHTMHSYDDTDYFVFDITDTDALYIIHSEWTEQNGNTVKPNPFFTLKSLDYLYTLALPSNLDNLFFTEPGTYFLTLHTNPASYSIQLLSQSMPILPDGSEPNGAPTFATSLPIENAFYEYSIHSNQDSDYFKLEITDVPIQLHATLAILDQYGETNPSSKLYMQLLNQDIDILMPLEDDGFPSYSINYMINETGTYYLNINSTCKCYEPMLAFNNICEDCSDDPWFTSQFSYVLGIFIK